MLRAGDYIVADLPALLAPGRVGTGPPFLTFDNFDALLLAGNFPFGICLHAGTLFIGLHEASLGFRDDLAVREGWLVASTFAVGHAQS